ncbi:uracil-DNA glycosylase [Neomegalonema sp.]|uniref:uracil-DNA glycosylase n=1 Tax=Neomegalonema sp. TaxID=2039713 RepID=UPI00260A1FF7|nr:uracil-DNA glycosylase [Neomegalonema sp.]MDD2869129.1 uracil-DNA glycosylase [Neomegalonema sp.]
MGIWRDQETDPQTGPGDWGALLPFLHKDASGESPCGRLLARIEAEAESGAQVLPPPQDLFKALRLTPPEKARVVILGQDPYPTPGDAMGLAFSVAPGVRTPRSLGNIFKEIEADLGVKAPRDGDLTRWAESGVLLLNSALTVRAGEAGAHAKYGWGALVDQILAHLGRPDSGRAFLLWGKHAQNLGAKVSRQGNLVIESAHPSPLSARTGFFGSRPFSQIDAFLKTRGAAPIRWT